MNEFQTSLRLEGMSEIQVGKSLLLLLLSDTCPRELNVIIKQKRFFIYVKKEEF